jgi:hypothetical protein
MLSAQCLLCLAMGVQWGLFLPKGAFGSKSTTRAAIEDFLVVDTISLVDIDLPMKLKALKLNPPPFCKTSHESSVNANPSYKLWLVPKLSQNNGPGHSEECRSPGTHRVSLVHYSLTYFPANVVAEPSPLNDACLYRLRDVAMISSKMSLEQ